VPEKPKITMFFTATVFAVRKFARLDAVEVAAPKFMEPDRTVHLAAFIMKRIHEKYPRTQNR
jgi:hypothetical protein